MKILRIRFKNLNSLAGEWSIDLTSKAYISDGIFAITGPTGAGKTTILDAICLALYGRTPRLAVVSKSQNDIMTRGASDCLAEAEIETANGRYCFIWSQRRARENTRYEFQDSRHEIIDMLTHQVKCDRKRDVEKKVEEITGMDFDRFTKSMLLAQGGFDAFLRAAPEDRRDILEKITGSEKYEKLAIYIHARKGKEEKKLDDLRNELTGISTLGAEEEREKIEELANRKKAEKLLDQKKKHADNVRKWRINLDNLLADKNSIEKKLADLRQDEDNFRADAMRLERGKKAALIAADYKNLNSLRSACEKKKKDLAEQKDLFPILLASCEKQKKEVADRIKELAAAKKRQSEAQPLLQKINALDLRIYEKQKELQKQEKSYGKDQEDIGKNEGYIKKIEKELEALRGRADQISSWRKEHAADEWLVQGLAGIIAKFGSLAQKQQNILDKKDKLEAAREETKKAANQLTKIENDCKRTRELLEKAAMELQQERDRLKTLLSGRELKDYRHDKEKLYEEKSRLNYIVSFEEERQKLEPNRPCPLCGSLEHPFAIHQIPSMDETQAKINKLGAIITEAEKMESSLRKNEDRQNKINNSLKDLKIQEASLKAKLEENEKTINDILSEKDNLIAAKKLEMDEVLTTLAPLGITELKDLNALCKDLRKRQDAWKDHGEKSGELDKNIGEANAELGTRQALLNEKKSNLRNKLELLESVKKDLDELKEERFQAFGNEDPHLVEEKMKTEAETGEKKKEEAEERLKGLDTRLQTIGAKIETLEKDLKNLSAELEAKATQFASACLEKGFNGEAEFIGAWIEPAEVERLEQKSRMLMARRAGLEARQNDVEQKISHERDLYHTDETQEMLKDTLDNLENEIGAHLQAIALLKVALDENGKAKMKLREKQADLDAREKEAMRWRELDELMGKATGKNFRGFVQSLTFEILVRHANAQLCKLTDRYLLKMGERGEEKKQLQFKVIDSYQGGEERSVANLSGGESFMISLALALGLSRITSENVKVDSLFLDEGFGTLDEEALDMALETLASLRQDGKMIGIISHVAALKERVGTQIIVKPLTGGRSAIEGPGCSGS